MKRLTNKNQILEGYIGADVIKKLSDLEDIEEELGIDLITYSKVMFRQVPRIYVREHNTKKKEIVEEEIYPDYYAKLWLFKRPRKAIGRGRDFCGYGKTWALTKEELELI